MTRTRRFLSAVVLCSAIVFLTLEAQAQSALRGEVSAAALPQTISSAKSQPLDVSEELQQSLEAEIELREAIMDLRDLLEDWPAGTSVVFDWVDADLVEHSVELTSVEEAEALLEELEFQLELASDRTALLQLQLQQAMLKLTQQIQMLSNVMKMKQESEKAIVRNIR